MQLRGWVFYTNALYKQSTKMTAKIIVTRKWPSVVEAELSRRYDVELNVDDVAFTDTQMRDALCSADAVLTTVTDDVGKHVFESFGGNTIRAKVIGNYGVGFSHIDIDSAIKNNIMVTNTPDVLSECTADIALTLMLMVARRAGEGERQLRSNGWEGWCPTHMIGTKVSGSTLGIVGFGRIGRETAKRARAFGMKIRVFNRSPVDPSVLSEFSAVQEGSLEQLMSSVDFLSLHCPGGSENTHLINSDNLAKMKSTAFIINTARGEIIDEEALFNALDRNQIAGAGLDVYQNEPRINSKYFVFDNVVLLPHLGSATASTREAMGFKVIQNLDQYFAGESPDNRVA